MTDSRGALFRSVLAGWTFMHVLCTPALAWAPVRAADDVQAIVQQAVACHTSSRASHR
jgi:hypothetical protein